MNNSSDSDMIGDSIPGKVELVNVCPNGNGRNHLVYLGIGEIRCLHCKASGH